MKTAQLLVVWTVVLASVSWAPCRLAAQSSEIQWQSDVREAIELASRTDRLVLLHFQADWCRPCQQLETFVFSNPLVSHRFADRVVPVKIDVDLNPDLVKEHAVTSIPTDVVMTPSGRVLIKQASPKTADDYARMLDRVLVAKRQSDSGHQNTLAQNIDHVTGNAIVDPMKVAKSSGFTPEGPSHAAPALPQHANQMAREFEARQSSSSKVELATGNSSDESQMLRPVAATQQDLDRSPSDNAFVPPQRIVNTTSGAMTPRTERTSAPSRSSQQIAAQPRENKTAGSGDDLTSKFNQLMAQRARPAATSASGGTAESVQRPSPGTLQPIGSNAAGDGAPGQEIPENNLAAQSNDFVPPKSRGGNDTRRNPLFSPQAAAPTQTQRGLATAESPDNTGGPLGAVTAQTSRQPVDSTVPQPPTIQPQNRSGGQSPPASRANDAPSRPAATSQPRLALHGMCPVTLLEESSWVKGDAAIGCIHRGRVYLFASHEKFEKFKTDPDRYSPLLAGYDPVIYHEQGRLVDGQESLGVFMGDDEGQSVVLFSTPETVQKFQADPQRYLKTIHQATRAADSVGNNSGTFHR